MSQDKTNEKPTSYLYFRRKEMARTVSAEQKSKQFDDYISFPPYIGQLLVSGNLVNESKEDKM